MQKMMIGIFAVMVMTTVLTAKEINNPQDAVLETGMEMSQIRKMLEVYISLGTNLNYRNPVQELHTQIENYEQLLVALDEKFKNETVQMSLTRSRHAWKPVKKALLTALDKNADKENMKKTAIYIHGHIRILIRELSFLKQHFLEQVEINDKESLNASIEVAASARRLSAHYMMKMWKVDDPTIQEHWEKGLKIYEDSVRILEQSHFTQDSDFLKYLNKCKKYYSYFKRMGEKDHFSPALMTKKTTIVFDNANKMTEIILEKKD